MAVRGPRVPGCLPKARGGSAWITMNPSRLIGITQHISYLTVPAQMFIEHMQSGKSEPGYRVRAGM